MAVSGDGGTWATAFKTVQEAINARCVQEIWVKAGTYFPTKDIFRNATPVDNRAKTFLLKSGVAVYGGFAGTETLLAQRNWTTNATVLSGDLDNNDNPSNFTNHTNNAYHVVLTFNATAPTRLDGFTLKGGNANNSANVNLGFGSATWNQNGAGIFSYGGGTNLNSQNLIISQNKADGSGGGIYNDNSSPTITNITIANNNANFGSGGGIYNGNSSIPTIINVTIVNNNANSGGGVYNNNSSPTLTNVTIANNNVTFDGGGIYNGNNSNPNIKNTIVFGNTATATQGISNISSTPVITYSNIQDLVAAGTNINSNPLFINSADPDGADNIFMTADDGLALQCASPSINAGTNTGAPTTDILGVAIVATTKDMGAYEFSGILGNAFLATSTQSNITLVNQCENADWTYYSLSTEPNKWLIGINWAVDGSLSTLNSTAKAAAQVKITLDATYTSVTNVPLAQGIWTGGRYWNVVIGINPLDEAVNVRYYYDPAEITAINALASAWATANSGVYIPAKFFKTVGSAFNPATQVAYNTINAGNAIELTTNTTATGAHNDIDYIDFNGVSSFSGGGAFAQVGVTPLPVEFLNFSGKHQNNTNLLTWATTNEVNNSYFEIERSINAIDFVKISVVNANLTNESIKNYAFSDVSFTETTNYYRLKQVDNNGKTDYSKIIAIKSGQNTDISVDIYPNPSKNTFIIDVNGDVSAKYSIVVYDMQGKSVVNREVSSNKCVISLDNCVSGVYFVKISSENSVITKKIVKN